MQFFIIEIQGTIATTMIQIRITILVISIYLRIDFKFLFWIRMVVVTIEFRNSYLWNFNIMNAVTICFNKLNKINNLIYNNYFCYLKNSLFLAILIIIGIDDILIMQVSNKEATALMLASFFSFWTVIDLCSILTLFAK